MNVLQNEEDVPQNESFDIKKEIVKLINEDLQITREHIAKELNISSKTVGRYLSKLGISWEGHPKTGHWKLP
ncbi:winged helix-turn-helix transcriptional regulator [Barnesiella sp. CU968]|uniref:winged helix-turn-helix domain-containing protein n=1 Tax=Barnesiella sp. CU968 TaxID=2780099 RepID=UPI000F51A10F|nr:HTH domain-containing protein [Muribaculaceae bacterium Isolate-036 (Harlan)]RXE66194.1 HTH domain-containing protein [Muribaculaceae bacterium Isolate-001 (NCI)]